MDRALDALVAQHVMGWQSSEADERLEGLVPAWMKSETNSAGHTYPVWAGYLVNPLDPATVAREDAGEQPLVCYPEFVGGEHFAPSESWAHMGMVVEAMRARGFYFELGDRFGDDGEHPHGFYASFEPLAVRQERDQAGWLDDPDDQWWRHATTAPRAVALAALAALGVEVENAKGME